VPADGCLNILLDVHQNEWIGGFGLDSDVHITILPGFIPRKRAEHPNLENAVFRRLLSFESPQDVEDLVSIHDRSPTLPLIIFVVTWLLLIAVASSQHHRESPPVDQTREGYALAPP
jgi:hypothetical protein